MNPILTRGVESIESLEAKLREAIRRLLPGAPHELLEIASQFLLRTRREMRVRRLAAPRVVLDSAQRLTERKRQQLKDAGVTEEALGKIEELYPLADDLQREESVQSQLEFDHGCAKCAFFCSSWERSRGAEDGAPGPLCAIYGGVPAFCFDFMATRFCSACGRRVTPRHVAGGDPIPVECADCYRRKWAA